MGNVVVEAIGVSRLKENEILKFVGISLMDVAAVRAAKCGTRRSTGMSIRPWIPHQQIGTLPHESVEWPELAPKEPEHFPIKAIDPESRVPDMRRSMKDKAP